MRQELAEPTRYNHSPFVHVYMSYAWALPVNALANVPFDVGVVNENGCYNFGSPSFFRAPSAGRYMFMLNLAIFGTTNAVAYARVVRTDTNAVGVKQTLRITGTGASAPSIINLAGAGVLEADIGDNFYIQVLCTAGGNFAGGNTGEWDTLQIIRLT